MSESSLSLLKPLGDGNSLSEQDLIDLYRVPDRAVPWVRVNFVSSVDGSGTRDGLSGGLSGEADKRVFGILRRLCDVILVGAGTVRGEGYGAMKLGARSVAWRHSQGLAGQPVFAIVSARLELDPTSTIFSDAPVRPIILTAEDAPPERRKLLASVADVVSCGEHVAEPRRIVENLVERGLPQIHCEGGPTLFGAMIADGCVDELCLTLNPSLEAGTGQRISGNAATQTSTDLQLAHVLRSEGSELILRYVRA